MNEDQKTKEYLEKMKGIKLSDSSRARIEEALISHARFHTVTEGVRVAEDSRFIKQVPHRTSFIAQLFSLKFKHMTAALLIALLLGGGTSYAAQGAVPGDLLYPVKVEVNENIQSAVAISNESEAILQARLVQERLKEAEKLASEGKLDADTSANIMARLTAHYEEASERSEKAETEGKLETAATVRASLEGSFRSYANILTSIDIERGTQGSTTIVTDIKQYADDTAQASATATVNVSSNSRVNVETTIDRAGILLGAMESKLTRSKELLMPEVYARLQAELRLASDTYAQAQTAFDAEMYSEAYASAQTAMRLVNQSEAIIASSLRTKIDIGVDTALDAVVDVRRGTNTTVNTDIEEETNADMNATRPADSADEDTQWSDTDGAIDIDLNTDVRTDILDTSVNAETNVKTNLGL